MVSLLCSRALKIPSGCGPFDLRLQVRAAFRFFRRKSINSSTIASRISHYVSNARCRTFIDLKENARPRSFPEDSILAAPDRVERLHDLHEIFYIPNAWVWAEIEGSILFDISRDGKCGEGVLDAQPEGDVRLVIFQESVVFGLVLLDEIVLKEKGLFCFPSALRDVINVLEEPLCQPSLCPSPK
jgi:hypothetical protein